MATTVAIPIYREHVAPCFEVAQKFLIARFEGNQEVSREIVKSSGCTGFGNLQLLRDQKVSTLICNGIKAFYRDTIVASRIEVIDNISLAVDDVLSGWVSQKLRAGGTVAEDDACPPVPLPDLVCWTKELFTSHGYKVETRDPSEVFPVDLVAEITCPICERPVRVAICCGAHTYRCSQEIAELSRVSRANYHARVYVRPSSPQVEKCCREYGIELIDPNAKFAHADHPAADRLPILQQMVEGHERASGNQTEES